MCGWLLCAPPTGDLARNRGMCPNDWESNRRPFGSKPMLNPLSCTSQGHQVDLIKKLYNTQERLQKSKTSTQMPRSRMGLKLFQYWHTEDRGRHRIKNWPWTLNQVLLGALSLLGEIVQLLI